MKPYVFTLLALLVLSACGGTKTATFTCPNGPDLGVIYGDGSVELRLNDGRVATLPATATEDVYAAGDLVWQDTAFRSGRLTDGQSSYSCDQSSVER